LDSVALFGVEGVATAGAGVAALTSFIMNINCAFEFFAVLLT